MILDGKATADKICNNLKQQVDELMADGVYPKLRIVTTGNNDASKVYVRNKVKRCNEIGIEPIVKHFDFITKNDVKDLLTDSIPTIFQSPMTGSVPFDEIGAIMNPFVDVDGFVATENVARLASGKDPIMNPCTPAGIMRLLHEYNINVSGLAVTIVGRSNIVGRPLARMMEHEGATVTLCHSKTDESHIYPNVLLSDIVVSATGSRGILTYDKLAAASEKDISLCDHLIGRTVFIDVGMNRNEDGKLCGDIDQAILDRSFGYTPVPGGVGPMTVAMLMENTVKYYREL